MELITKKEAKNLSAQEHKSLWFMRDFEIGLSVRPVRRGDYFVVVFSDGLSNFVEAEEMG